jgi:hypothetical protein
MQRVATCRAQCQRCTAPQRTSRCTALQHVALRCNLLRCAATGCIAMQKLFRKTDDKSSAYSAELHLIRRCVGSVTAGAYQT